MDDAADRTGTGENMQRKANVKDDLAQRLERAREAFVRAFPKLNALRFYKGMVIPCRVKVCKGKRT